MPAASPRHANNPDLLALGQAIRTVRKAQGVSQEDLAHIADIDRAYVSSIERGQQNVGIVTVLRVARTLNLTLADLATRAGL